MKNPPTGFIRTLPPFYADGGHKAGRAHRLALKRLETDDSAYLYIALSQQPRREVLYVYLCIAGKITVRLNLAGYEDGDARECFDGSMRKPAAWAICTGPVSRPPEPIDRRGLRHPLHGGFMVTYNRWIEDRLTSVTLRLVDHETFIKLAVGVVGAILGWALKTATDHSSSWKDSVRALYQFDGELKMIKAQHDAATEWLHLADRLAAANAPEHAGIREAAVKLLKAMPRLTVLTSEYAALHRVLDHGERTLSEAVVSFYNAQQEAFSGSRLEMRSVDDLQQIIRAKVRYLDLRFHVFRPFKRNKYIAKRDEAFRRVRHRKEAGDLEGPLKDALQLVFKN